MEEIKAIEFVNEAEKDLNALFKQIDDVVLYNQKKVLDAFKLCEVALRHMASSSGYGYEDVAKPKLSELYSKIFHTEDAIVSPLITCGTHALASCLFGILRPNDLMLSISGNPYDTLEECIHGDNIGSLKDFGVKFESIEMIGDNFDEDAIIKKLSEVTPKMIFIQRSRGYSSRQALCI